MNIDPGSDVPLFVQIAEGIEEDIFTGSYAEGDRIPSTNELSALLGINPHTVLKGMNILVDGEPAADNARALTKLYCMNDKKMYPENLRLDNLFKEMGRFYEGFDRTAAAGFAEAFGLDLRKKIGSLSTGYRSVYQLVVGLSLDVDYLLLDEPVLGLDANHRELFYKLLLDDYLEKQRTVIIATHLIEEVANLVEQVTIVDRGRVLLASSAEELRASGYSVSGRTADVAAYCAGMEVLDVEELGGLSVAYVQGKPDAARLNERLDVAPLNLQKLFVKLTEKEEAR